MKPILFTLNTFAGWNRVASMPFTSLQEAMDNARALRSGEHGEDYAEVTRARDGKMLYRRALEQNK